MTPQEMHDYIMGAPDPLDGLPIFDRFGEDNTDQGYNEAGRAAAKALLIVCKENPSLLEVPSKEDDPNGIKRAFADKHWQAAKERWPGLDNWLGGITGFQFGWANNAMRYALEVETVGNPALMTIKV